MNIVRQSAADPSGSPTGSSPGSRRVVLVRHAETAENAAGRFLGRSDPGLSPTGVGQAERLASVFTPGGSHRILSSPARRALETAQLLGLHAPVIEADLREIDFGAWEGLTQAEVSERDPENFRAFAGGDIDGFPGGETVAAVADRTVAVLDAHRPDSLVVVTHATVVRILVTALVGLPVSSYRSAFGRPGHVSLTELEQHEGGWRLLTYDSRPIRDIPEGAGGASGAAAPRP